MDVAFAVGYRRLDADGQYGPARVASTRTIGLGGVMFEVDDPLEKGEGLEIELVMGARVITAAGRVVYVDPLPEGVYSIGVEFTTISEQDREYLLACYLQHEYRINPD